MGRTFALVVGLAISLLGARGASATPIALDSEASDIFGHAFLDDLERIDLTSGDGWRFSQLPRLGQDLGFLASLDDADRAKWFQLIEEKFGRDFNPRWEGFEPIRFFFVCGVPPGWLKNGGPWWWRGDNGPGNSPSPDSVAPMPEPGSMVLFGSGLAGLYAAMRRRRKPANESPTSESAA